MPRTLRALVSHRMQFVTYGPHVNRPGYRAQEISDARRKCNQNRLVSHARHAFSNGTLVMV